MRPPITPLIGGLAVLRSPIADGVCLTIATILPDQGSPKLLRAPRMRNYLATPARRPKHRSLPTSWFGRFLPPQAFLHRILTCAWPTRRRPHGTFSWIARPYGLGRKAPLAVPLATPSQSANITTAW